MTTASFVEIMGTKERKQSTRHSCVLNTVAPVTNAFVIHATPSYVSSAAAYIGTQGTLTYMSVNHPTSSVLVNHLMKQNHLKQPTRVGLLRNTHTLFRRANIRKLWTLLITMRKTLG